MSDVDLERFAEIPDPFADAATAPLLRVDPKPSVRSPTRSHVRMLRSIAAGAAILYDAAWPAIVERRKDLGSVSPSALALGLAIPLVAGALAMSTVGRPGDRGLGEPKARLLTLVIASPVVFAVATLLTAPDAVEGDRFWRQAFGCALVTALLAAGPLTFGVLAFRRAFAAASFWRTAAVGVASGALAAATMSIACPIGSAGHVLLGHGSMMVFAGVVGAVWGHRVCRA
jgi:hypothetical protein